jgi:DMSO/TMAO reductase YedYZ molybdopterin-dependent catalytic subunit
MEKVKRFKRLFIVAVVLLLIVLIIAGIYWQITPRMLYPEEIREYEGQDLSSLVDIKDNAIKGTQNIDASTYRLTINGLVNKTLEFTYDQVINGHQKYQKVVTLHCVEGWSAKILWEGILVRDLIQAAEINPAAKVVIFHAADDYTTSFPVDYFFDNDILIAYKMNDLTIPPEKGFPFQLVAESKYGYKWIKWITQIELSDNENYKGYWESRGFSNDADLP